MRDKSGEYLNWLDSEFGWFFAKHQLRRISNGLLDAILQSLTNGRVVTLRSEKVDLRLSSLADGFHIVTRLNQSRDSWHTLPSLLNNLPPEDSDWLTMLQHLDTHWAELISILESREAA